MSLRHPLSALALFLLTASCTKPIGRPTFSQKSGANSEVGNNNTGGDGTNTSNVVPVVPEIPAEIQLVNSKFTGEESKLEASVKFAGATSARLKLTASAGIASLSVPALVTGQADTLVVEIYEGQKLRFLARRANTTVEKGKANSWKLEDCSISKVPWDGETNETTCGWSVQDNK